MRKNIFIKSMLRRPLHTIVLTLLIGLAAFAFVLRTVEFLLVRGQIMAAAEEYRTTGFINHPMWFGDVSEGIKILSSSPYVGLETRRRAAEGILRDMYNADFTGMRVQLLHSREGRGLQPRLTETYFYAYLVYIHGDYYGRVYWLELLVDEVLVGHPEYAVAGQAMYMLFRPGPFSYRYAIADMVVGQRYFLVGAYIRQYPHSPAGVFDPHPAHGPIIPRVGREDDWLVLWPLNEEGRTNEHIWHVHVPTGQSVDFSLPGLSHIPEHIEILRNDQRSMQIQAITSMRDMPEIGRSILLHEGRLLDYDDYIYANPVAVIDVTFANARDLELGDTLAISIPRQQNFFGGIGTPGFITPLVRVDRQFPERYHDAHEVELTIVGITRFHEFTRYSDQSLFVFMPYSLLPEDYGIAWRQWGWGYLDDGELGRVELPSIDFGREHIPDIWYGFTLTDARNERDFYEYYRWLFYEMDMDLVMYFSEPENFWLSAIPVLLTIAFNAVLFWVVLILVLALVAFIYLRQKRLEFAILRALGRSVGRIYVGLIMSAILFCLPAIATGGVVAWHVAHMEAEATLVQLEETYDDATPLTLFELHWQTHFGDRPMPGALDGVDAILDVYISMHWLAAFIGIVFVLMMVMITFGSIKMLRLPVLVQLQGNTSSPMKPNVDDSKATFIYNTALGKTIPNSQLVSTAKAKFAGALRWMRRQILRSLVKTALGIAVTIFFVIVLGLLQESINQTTHEIDRIYDTTIVQAEIIENPAVGASDHKFNDFIRRRTVERLIATGYVYSVYMEAAYAWTFVIAPVNGTLSPHWRSRIGLLPDRLPSSFHYYSLDFSLGISDINMFLYHHSVAANPHVIADMDGLGMIGGVAAGLRNAHITFADGFDASSFDKFNFQDGDPIPIIVSRHILNRRRLSLGDEALVGFRRQRNWEYSHAIIVGVHNGQIHTDNMQDGMLMPMWAFENVLLGITHNYTRLVLNIDPDNNRNLRPVRNAFELIINPIGEEAQLSMLFHDSELRSLLSAMEQILLLLQLVHPIAISIALIIGAGLTMLMQLQNAKNAAIMRVLGDSQTKTIFALWAEQVTICLIGIVVGLTALMLMGQSLEIVITLAGLYFAGVAIGAATGAIIVTAKAPLELLQVRE